MMPATRAQKRRAGELARQAIKDGVIIKPTSCEVCGAVSQMEERDGSKFLNGVLVPYTFLAPNPRIEAHHDDYSKPLDVRFLCTACHIAWHVRNGDRWPQCGRKADRKEVCV